jgi:hypothetical protein
MTEHVATERGYFEFKDTRNWLDAHGDLEAEIEAVSGQQGITISVTQEHSVSSYNETFTCTAVLPLAEAIRFRDWLNEVLG